MPYPSNQEGGEDFIGDGNLPDAWGRSYPSWEKPHVVRKPTRDGVIQLHSQPKIDDGEEIPNLVA